MLAKYWGQLLLQRHWTRTEKRYEQVEIQSWSLLYKHTLSGVFSWFSSWFLQWVQLFFLMKIWTSFKSTDGCLWLLFVSSVLSWTNSHWQEKPDALERVIAVARKSLPTLDKIMLRWNCCYDNMMIFIRVDTVIYNHSITLFTWEMLLLETTAHLYVQFNMCN